MDKYTTESITKVLKALDRVNGNLGHLVSFVSAEREKEKQATSRQGDPTESDYAAVGKTFIATYGNPPADNTEISEKTWYRRLQWWKPIIECVGIFFAIGYAVVTYLQWRDLRQNFLIEQRSWPETQISWPIPTANLLPSFNVNITNVGKIPILSMVAAGHVQVFANSQPPLLEDGEHRADLDFRGLVFPNHPISFSASLLDEASGQPRGFTDSELRDISEGRSYVAVIGFIKYRDELGSHWLRFCDWHNYVSGNTSNALACVMMNEAGDGDSPPKRAGSGSSPGR